MPKKCEYFDCGKKILSISIDCDKCHKYFCGAHRIPESHRCEKLDFIKKEAFENNKNNLENNKMLIVNKGLGTY